VSGYAIIPGNVLEAMADMSSATVRVAVAIASYMPGLQGSCHPSAKMLAGKAGVSQRQVFRSISDLAERGLLEVAAGGNHGRKHDTNIYQWQRLGVTPTSYLNKVRCDAQVIPKIFRYDKNGDLGMTPVSPSLLTSPLTLPGEDVNAHAQEKPETHYTTNPPPPDLDHLKTNNLIKEFMAMADWDGTDAKPSDHIKKTLKKYSAEEVYSEIENIRPGDKPWDIDNRLTWKRRKNQRKGTR